MTEEQISTRRAEIRQHVRDLLQEYLQLWENYEESILIGYVVVAEAHRPDVDGNTRFDFKSDGYSDFAADGLLWNRLKHD